MQNFLVEVHVGTIVFYVVIVVQEEVEFWCFQFSWNILTVVTAWSLLFRS